MVSFIRRMHHHFELRVRSLLRMKKRGVRFKDQRFTGPFKDGLWGEVERALSYHSGDQSPLHALNRLIHEEAQVLGSSLPAWIDENTYEITNEYWATERLVQLSRRHDRDLPRDENSPIIVCNIGTHSFLVDGHTRVNKWTKRKADRQHLVLVVRPQQLTQEAG
jgi:hypothetical protein